jgi:prepilin-type N-terminal cleavage/methylation domain-containing protein
MTRQDADRRSTEQRGRPGFTVVELLFVILIAGILTSFALPAFRDYTNRREVINARTAFMMAANRARASAIERGEVVVLMVRIYRDSVFVMNADWTDTIEMIDYRDGEIAANILLNSTPAPFRICYLPRGFVHPSCQDGEYLPATIGFTNWSGVDTVWADINAVGQVEPQ